MPHPPKPPPTTPSHRLRKLGWWMFAQIVAHAEGRLLHSPVLLFAVLSAVGLALVGAAGAAFAALTDGKANPLWWALTRMLDGGTFAGDWSDDGSRAVPLLALAVTVVGVFLLAVLTGAVASRLTALVQAWHDGWLPAPARGHLLVLGYNSQTGRALVAAHSSWRHGLVVVLADREPAHIRKDLIDNRVPDLRRIVVRRGDPRTLGDLQRVAVFAARAVLVTPVGQAQQPERASLWVMAVLLALRDVARHHRRPPPPCVAQVPSEVLGRAARMAWQGEAEAALALVPTQEGLVGSMVAALAGSTELLVWQRWVAGKELLITMVSEDTPLGRHHRLLGQLAGERFVLAAGHAAAGRGSRVIVQRTAAAAVTDQPPAVPHHTAHCPAQRGLLLSGWNPLVPAILQRLAEAPAQWHAVTLAVRAEFAAQAHAAAAVVPHLNVAVVSDGSNVAMAGQCDVVVHLNTTSDSDDGDMASIAGLLQLESQDVQARQIVQFAHVRSRELVRRVRPAGHAKVEVLVAPEALGALLGRLVRAALRDGGATGGGPGQLGTVFGHLLRGELALALQPAGDQPFAAISALAATQNQAVALGWVVGRSVTWLPDGHEIAPPGAQLIVLQQPEHRAT